MVGQIKNVFVTLLVLCWCIGCKVAYVPGQSSPSGTDLTPASNSPSPAPTPVPGISLDSQSWYIRSSDDGQPDHHPNAAANGWSFNFPVVADISSCSAIGKCPSINIVTTPYTTPIAIGKTVTMTFQINTTGTPQFNYMLDPTNTCVSPATVHLFIEHANDDFLTETYQWWAIPSSAVLAAGTVTLTAPITPDQWSDMYGNVGNLDSTRLAGFSDALANVGNIGMTFGGGCFLVHGVNISGGTAQFNLIDFQIQ
jgi:hypothetical protein